MRLGAGYADFNDLTEIVLGDFNVSKNYSVVNLDFGYRFVKNMWALPLDLYAKGGISYFDERFQDDFVDFTLYIKLYWKINFWKNRMRLGFGEGLSWAQKIPEVEIIDARHTDGTSDPTHKFLNYLDISVDFDLGCLVRVKALENMYVGYTIKHRSGVFGAFEGVHGGSNYSMLTFEKNF